MSNKENPKIDAVKIPVAGALTLLACHFVSPSLSRTPSAISLRLVMILGFSPLAPIARPQSLPLIFGG